MKKFVISAISFLMILAFCSCTQEVEKQDVKPVALEIGSLPAKLNYLKNEKTDYSGLTVNMVYTDGSRNKLAENEYSITPLAKTLLSEEGSQAVKISSDGKTAFFTISVKNPAETYSSSLEISSLPDKLSYFTNGTLDLKGLVVKMNKTDGTSTVLKESEYTVEPAEGTVLSDEGSQAVKISADGKTAFFTISVKNPSETYSSSLEISSLPNKLSYFTNGTLELKGLVVKMNKTDGTSKVLSESEYTVEPAEGTVLSEDGNQAVKISADGKTAFFSVYVGKTVYTGLKLKSMPEKTYYKDNEMFDTTGMEVVAAFDDGSERSLEAWEYKTNLQNGSSLQAGSGQKVTVTYCGKEVSFYINVGSTWETFTFVDDYENNDANSVGVKNHTITDICRGNTNLKTIVIPDTIKTIERYAFKGCTALEEVEFPDGIGIQKEAFNGCKSLKSIKFKGSVNLSDGAFKDCENISGELIFPGYVTFPSSNNNESVFENCNNITSVIFHGGITGEGAFRNCTALKTVDFNKSDSNWNLVFEGCTALKNVKNMRNCKVFKDCTSLANIELSDTCVSIPENAFYGCLNLENINIPNSVVYIQDKAFVNCSKITSIQIPYKVETISLSSFYGCENLQEIKLCSENLSAIAIGSVDADPYGSQAAVVEYLKEKNVKISYNGTKEQFCKIKIQIGLYHFYNASNYLNGVTIYCTDGSFVYGE